MEGVTRLLKERETPMFQEGTEAMAEFMSKQSCRDMNRRHWYGIWWLTSQYDHGVVVASSHVVVAGVGLCASQLGTAPR